MRVRSRKYRLYFIELVSSVETRYLCSYLKRPMMTDSKMKTAIISHDNVFIRNKPSSILHIK